MEFFPFFRRPYYYYNQNMYLNQKRYNQERIQEERESRARQNQEQSLQNSANRKKEIRIADKKTENNRTIQKDDEPAFEIFGIKLYFDDILIIALIFFLYNEGVRDNFLFISLILILLS